MKKSSLLLLFLFSCTSPKAPTTPSAERATRPEQAPERLSLRRSTVLWGEHWPEGYDWPAQPLTFEDTLFMAGQRSGLFSPHTGGLTDREAWNAKRPINLLGVTFLSAEPNYPQAVGKTGTYWCSRAHLINSCTVDDLIARDIFGSSYSGQPPLVTSNEGHVLYWTLAPDETSNYVFRNMDIRNTGGHAIQFVTAVGARKSLDAPPRPGGYMRIEDVYIENTDQSPARGSSSISFFDLPLTVELDNVIVRNGVGNIPYPVWGWDGTLEDAYTSRGCFVQRGWMRSLKVTNSTFEQNGDRPDRSSVSLRGVREAFFENCYIRGNLVVNYPADGVTHWTQRIVIKNCRSNGRLYIGKQNVGPLSDNYDLELVPPSHLDASPLRSGFDDSKHDDYLRDRP